MHSTEITGKLGVATFTIHKRIEKLRNSEVIKEFTIMIDPSSVGLNITTYIGINIEPSKKISIISDIPPSTRQRPPASLTFQRTSPQALIRTCPALLSVVY